MPFHSRPACAAADRFFARGHAALHQVAPSIPWPAHACECIGLACKQLDLLWLLALIWARRPALLHPKGVTGVPLALCLFVFFSAANAGQILSASTSCLVLTTKEASTTLRNSFQHRKLRDLYFTAVTAAHHLTSFMLEIGGTICRRMWPVSLKSCPLSFATPQPCHSCTAVLDITARPLLPFRPPCTLETHKSLDKPEPVESN